jgi:hypothetical protein
VWAASQGEFALPVLSSSDILREAATLGLNSNATPKPQRSKWAEREAVLSIFRDPPPERCSRLESLSEKTWRDLLQWLDYSGLALYFLDRMVDLELSHWLPAPVSERLRRNLADNAERTCGMFAESAAIQQQLQRVGLSYAVLKGVSFWPCAVPKPELRSQFDLDFLVAERSAPEARRILERRGYRLYAISGRSWEFKLNERPGVSLKDLYKPMPSHAVELHLVPDAAARPSPLDHIEFRPLFGMEMPVLAPVDLFLGQALHLYKHLCGEFSRASHLLEFRRHVLMRRDDDAFWNNLHSVAGSSERAALGLGLVTLLITRIMGNFAPDALTSWTINRLPDPVRLWVEMHGNRAVFGSFPGTKLYLLLQREMAPAGIPARRSAAKALLPSCLPPAVIKAFPNETMPVRISRYRMQLELVLLRLRFHLVEGIRYAWESYRWKQQRSRLGR